MTFEEWWRENASGGVDKHSARLGWERGRVVERGRCAEIAKEYDHYAACDACCGSHISEQILEDCVPPIPPREVHTGVVNEGDERWRFENGKLHRYIRYAHRKSEPVVILDSWTSPDCPFGTVREIETEEPYVVETP